MIATILSDGRKVQADECESLELAMGAIPHSGQGILTTPPDLQYHTMFRYIGRAPQQQWHLVCYCCEGSGTHGWSPASYYNGANGPDSGEYDCEPCAGTGEFKVVTS